MMRILFLTQWFDPESTFKGMVFVKEFVKRGNDVQVLTGFPCYPGGKIYPGYKVKLFQKEKMEGIDVIRVALYPSHDSSKIGRIINYISFSIFALIIGVFLIKKADIMYVYHPPATVGISACFLSFLRGIPFVYDIQDLWPDSLKSTGMMNSRLVLRMVDRICMWIYKHAAHIVVLSPGFRSELIKRGVPDHKISVIYNWCDEKFFLGTYENKNHLNIQQKTERFNILFAGNIGKAQALEAILEAAKIVEKKKSQIEYIFVGNGIELENLRKKTAVEEIGNVLFLSKKPIQEIGAILQAADVLLVHLKDDPLFQITIPSKIQAYLAVGRPILVAVRGDAAELVKKAKAGITCIPEDVDGIVKVSEQMAAMPKDELNRLGENGRIFYKKYLSMAVGLDKFESLFKIIVNK